MAALVKFVLAAALIIAGAILSLRFYGPAGFWEAAWENAGGPADQGRVDFDALDRPSWPTDALACTPTLCSGERDFPLPAYFDEPAELMEKFDRAALADPDVSRVDDGRDPTYRRYVARTHVLRFPDTLQAMAVPMGETAGLKLYGRALLGRGDWGANARRMRAIVGRLG